MYGKGGQCQLFQYPARYPEWVPNERYWNHAHRKEKTFGSVTHRTDRDSYRAKYTHNGEVITKTFKDERSAQAWLSAEKALVEADRAGIQRGGVAQPTVNGRKRP